MCGIITIINKNQDPVDQGLLKRMTNSLIHRGPDGEGYYKYKHFGIGHRRLAIIDLSDVAGQPMQKNGLILAYNGEIYNFKELRAFLQKNGVRFNSESDTEVLLEGYRYWGPGFEAKLNGMWAFILYDQQKQKFYISRDRYGMKPLYVLDTKGAIYFASEIKSFFQIKSFQKNLNSSIAYDFIINGLLHHSEESFFEGVHMLPSGHYMIYDILGNLKVIKQYFSISQNLQGVDNYFLRDAFVNAVERHLVSDVEVGASLSGGIDSSAICSIAGEKLNSLKTFSYVPKENIYNEIKYINEIIKEKEFSNQSISPGFEDHIDVHHEVMRANDSPSLSINLLSHYLLYKLVHQNKVKVLLAGQGADELFFGYGTYYIYFLRYLLKKNPALALKESYFLIRNYPGFLSKIRSKLSQKTMYNQYLVKKEMTNEVNVPKDLFGYYKSMINYQILPALLQFEDRNSMANSVEARLPFLDLEFSELCHNVIPEQKIRKGLRKAIFRQAMGQIVPDIILNRKDKIGFLTPQELWMEKYQNNLIDTIKSHVGNHPDWLCDQTSKFIQISFRHKARVHYPFIWRVYSFLEFINLDC